MTEANANEEKTNGKAAVATKTGVFPDLREEIDRLWEATMANPWRPFRAYTREPVFPAIDVFEKDGALKVHAELPGLAEKDVEITIEGNTLVITGEKTQSSEVKEKDYYRRERSFGRFSRRVGLPDGAQKDKVSAQFKDGVLEVEIPLQATAAQKIEIKHA